ncbi:hypothetical protein LOTGIDRAFT_103277, partial [Lottia gigantea]
TGCPSIITPLKDITTSDRTSVTLECYITGIPTPEIVWYLNNNPITDLSIYAVSYDSETGRAALVIEDVTERLEGVFRCFLKNDVGEAETRCILSVKNTPKHVPSFTEPLHDVKVSEGHSVTLTCRVADAESVVWQKDGVVQKSTEDFKQSFDGEEAKLELDEVFLDDFGIYSCIARNDLGEESSSCKLKVTGEFEISILFRHTCLIYRCCQVSIAFACCPPLYRRKTQFYRFFVFFQCPNSLP